MFDEVNTQPEIQEQSTPQPEKIVASSEKEENLRILRERAERAERKVYEMEQQSLRTSPQAAVEEITDDIDEDGFQIDDEGFVEGKHLKKFVQNMKKELKKTKEEFAAYSQQSSLTSAELRLKAKYADLDQVVTQENLNKLAEVKPSLYKSILANPDVFEKGEAAYEIIKSMNIGSGAKYADNERKIEENKSKPRTAATVGAQTPQTPLTRVGDYDRRILTEERKHQLREQVRLAKEKGY